MEKKLRDCPPPENFGIENFLGNFIYKKQYFCYNIDMIHHRKKAFTLAETLITLGIIGIVAALTLPTIITKYQKKETAKRLQQAYNLLQQTANLAQVEYGDMETWDCFEKGSMSAEQFANKYIIPFFKDTNINRYGSWIIAGYKRPPKQMNGADTSAAQYYFQTSQGYIYSTFAYDSSDRRIFLVYIDINGTKGKNISGRDIFVATYGYSSKKDYFYKLHMYNFSQSDRDTILRESCNKTGGNGAYCGALIEMDGWEIKDSYPW